MLRSQAPQSPIGSSGLPTAPTRNVLCGASTVILKLGEPMRRREFITLLGSAAVAGPLAAHAQQPAMPVIGFLHSASAAAYTGLVAAFRKGLGEATAATLAAKAATMTIPIVFLSAVDPVKTGLVASLQPARAATSPMSATLACSLRQNDSGSCTSCSREPRGLACLIPAIRELPSDRSADGGFGNRPADRSLAARTDSDIDKAFATLVNKRADAFLVSTDASFVTRRVQLVTRAARHAVPAMYFRREFAEAGGLMSYGSTLAARAANRETLQSRNRLRPGATLHPPGDGRI